MALPVNASNYTISRPLNLSMATPVTSTMSQTYQLRPTALTIFPHQQAGLPHLLSRDAYRNVRRNRQRPRLRLWHPSLCHIQCTSLKTSGPLGMSMPLPQGLGVAPSSVLSISRTRSALLLLLAIRRLRPLRDNVVPRLSAAADLVNATPMLLSPRCHPYPRPCSTTNLRTRKHSKQRLRWLHQGAKLKRTIVV